MSLDWNKSVKIFLHFFLITIFTMLVSQEAKAQMVYEVNGTVKKNKKKLEGAIVSLYKGSTQVQQVTTSSNGRFNVKLDFNAEYTLTISKPGHISKKFYFNTKGVPDDRVKEEFGGQDIEVSIFELPKDPGVVSQVNSILSQPMAKFYYDDKIKEIDFDKSYSQSMLDALAKLGEIEKEANKKAEDEAKQKQALDAEIASKYDAAIAKGDAAFGKKDYTTARTAYTDALSIKPGEAYPKGKIVEIEKLLADAAKNAGLEADYKAAIAKADAAFTAKDYPSAKTSYNDALKLKPAEAYPKTKLAEIDAALAKLASEKELNAKYDAAIAKADKALAAKTYDAAKAGYNEAIALKASEKYPKDKITEIDKILADLANKEKSEKELNDKYNAAIAKGDKAFAAKDYPNAKAGYNEALALKSAEAYPKTKIAEIDKILADLAAKEAADKEKLAKEKELNDKYNAAIAKADKALAAKTYDAAKAGYNEALAIKSAEQYPKDKIAEIDKILADIAAKDAAEKDKLAKEKELNDKYNAAIAKGDKALAAKTYDAAKAAYNEALALKSAEAYPKTKLAEIDKILADLAAKDAAEKEKQAKEKELNDKYNAAIAKADKAFAAKTYDAAKAGYNEALGLKSGEQYPKDKIAEIEKILLDLASKDAAEKEKQAKEKELTEKYNAAVAKGDKALAAKSYDEAKAGYNEALGFKPAEAYPKTKLAEIDKILADLAAKDKAEKDRLAKEKELAEKYAAAISKADAALSSKDYTNAKAGYNEAISYKAGEQYPKDKIKEIDALVAKELGAKALEEKYKAALAKGDAALSKKDYTTAKSGYSDALALKPSEQYPKDKLAEIDKALADEAAEKDRLAKAAELESKYKAALAKGDAALKAKTYEAAKAGYNEALSLKSSEQYPKDKIAEIDALIAKEMGAKELDEKYKAAVAKGDKALTAKSYDEAKTGYNEALGFKPAEAYPKTKLSEIEKILADLAAKDKAEQDRLAKEKELGEKYAAAIAKADAALGTKDYDAAKNSYTEASGFKPAEKYPKDKIAEINAILAKEMGAKELEKKYTDAIAKGDAALGTKDYPTAKTQYTGALALKPTEQYPKDKLAEVEKALAEIAAAKDKDAAAKALEAKYTAAIAKADKAFAAKTYDAAKTAYNEALGIKSAEQYPKDKIAEIDKLIAEMSSAKDKAALEAKYTAAIAKGDKAFAAKTYDAAKAAYNEALGVKSGEQYPKDKIAEIEKLISEMSSAKDKAALDAKYTAAIAKGDKAFAAKTYDAAKAAYNEALGIKSSEQYPKDKIAEIEKIIADMASSKDKAEQDRLAKEKELAEKYAAAIAKGDASLASKDYEPAKSSYTEASGIKPAEKYPKDKIAEINAILAKEMGAKELEKKYADAISKGDAAFGTKEYSSAKTQYTAALALKPNEQYPKDKLAEIEKALAELAASKDKEAAQKALDAKYAAAIAKGDKAFAAKTYEAAKSGYNEALGIKSSEQYPKDKITEIEKILSELANKDVAGKELAAKYNAAIAKADAALATKDYNGAKAGYNEALGIKPAEKYPQDKIASIDALLAKELGAKATEEKYKAAIAKADEAFAGKNYPDAKTSYMEASGLKPAEQYPKDQLLKVNSVLADIAKNRAVQEKYDAAAKKADGLLADKKYPEAIVAYKEAQTIKPNEPYPANKISEINKIIDGLSRSKEKDQQYDAIIAKADKLFTSKDYKMAKSAYQDALLVKASEKYPKDKIAEIDVLMKNKNTSATTAVVKDNKSEYVNALAQKYPEGITEELGRENNAKVTRRIVVKGKEGHMYIKKETSFGPIYYFKDDVPITEQEFVKDTEVQQ
jgi:Trp operon repressor